MHRLNDICLLMEGQLPYLWFAGEGFTVLKGNTELVVNVDEIKDDFISAFELYQNYPNPFNPSTSIRFTISSVLASETKQSQLVTLKIYGVLGNEVATLVNEQKPAGSYEVKFDAAGLSSGMYFYTLANGSFVETKKMILLK
ncbi:MAG: T9SS type A sorting domain-containing protein [Ignavibacteriaceae bacterium]|nr:T9SS type A sorting domain-containing protein [Ignavibacteriaceae bacterium]